MRFAVDDPRTPAVEQAGQRRFNAPNQPLLGTGEGANVTIHYHPLTWLMDSLRTGMIGKLMPDDVLLHELVHALRMMSGQAVTLDLGTLRHTQRWATPRSSMRS